MIVKRGIMRDLSRKNNDSLDWKAEEKVLIEHPECKKTVRGKKVSLSKKAEKIYKVTVIYIQLTDEEIKIKRAIIESILKKGYKKHD